MNRKQAPKNQVPPLLIPHSEFRTPSFHSRKRCERSGDIRHHITLLIGPRARREAMHDLTAVLALRGQVRVIDGAGQSPGYSFDPYPVARAIRRRTHRLDEIFARVTIARAFTCYQVVHLLEQTPATDRPHLVCDLTATFYDEAVSYAESVRLLHLAAAERQRLRRRAPVIITARPAPRGERSGLLRLLQETADQVLLPGTEPEIGSAFAKLI